MGFHIFGKKKKRTIEDDFDNENLLDMLSPDSIHEGEGYVRSGSNYTRTLTLVSYKTVLDKKRVQALNDMSENISIVQHMQEFDPSDVRRGLSNSITQNTHKVHSKYLNESVKADAEAEIQSARMMLDRISSGQDKIFLFEMLIHVVAKDLDELDSLTTKVKTVVGSFAKINDPNTRGKDAFDSFLPLGKNKVQDLTYRPMNTEAVSFMFPFHENEIFDDDGIIKGRNLTTKNIVIVNDDLLINRHRFLIGISGSGKSTELFQDMMRKYMIGRRIIVIDPKRDFGEPIRTMGGEWVKIGFKGENIINPMEIPNTYRAEETNPLLTQVSTLLTLFKLMYPAMDELQEDILSILLIRMYESNEFNITENTDLSQLGSKDFPTLRDFYNFLEEISQSKDLKDQHSYERIMDFHKSLEAYAYGMFSKIFNGHTNVDIKNKLVTYDIFELDDHPKAQRLIYFILLSHIKYDIVNGDLTTTQLYIDEAHLIADPKVPVAMEYLFTMMKVLRSFECGVTAATQSIKDFLSAKDEHRNYGEAVISQTVQSLFLPMKPMEIDFLEEELGYEFSEEERTTLTLIEGKKEEQAGKGIYFVGANKIKIEIQLTEMEKQLWFEKKNVSELVL